MRDWRGNDCDDETDFLSQIPHCSPLLWQQLLCVFCVCFLPDEFLISTFFDQLYPTFNGFCCFMKGGLALSENFQVDNPENDDPLLLLTICIQYQL